MQKLISDCFHEEDHRLILQQVGHTTVQAVCGKCHKTMGMGTDFGNGASITFHHSLTVDDKSGITLEYTET